MLRILMSYMLAFFAVGLVFYGPSIDLDALSGSFHLNQFLLGIVQLPAIVGATLLVDRLGRKPLIVAGFVLASVAYVVCALLKGWM